MTRDGIVVNECLVDWCLFDPGSSSVVENLTSDVFTTVLMTVLHRRHQSTFDVTASTLSAHLFANGRLIDNRKQELGVILGLGLNAKNKAPMTSGPCRVSPLEKYNKQWIPPYRPFLLLL